MARKNYWGNYRCKHKVAKGNKVCIPAYEFDEFRCPGAHLPGNRWCHSRKGLRKDQEGHWVYIDRGKHFKQKKGKKGPYVHYSTL